MSYLAQVSLYWLLLYGCYWLVLRRHTFFAWNRAYLLGSLLGAFALPLVPYPDIAPSMPRIVYQLAALPTETMTIVETQHDVSLPNAPSAEPFPWVEVLWIIYALGVVVMAIRLFLHLRQVRAFIQQGTSLDMDGYRLYLLDTNTVGSFSFLNYIVINRTDYAHNFDTILSHELAHVRQRHSWDILLVEVLWVVFWFNPVLILYKKSLQQVHEYLADRAVCEWEATPRDRYAEFMVSYALGSPMAALVNPFFNSSLLKDRIVMLYKNRNSNWSLGKYAAVALLVGFVSMLAASCEQKADEKSETAIEKPTLTAIPNDTVIEVKEEFIPNYATDSIYTVVKQNPKFPGGLKAMYKFIQDEMKYPAAARRANVEGKVFLTFVVNSDGSIQNIQVLKGMGFGTDEEAIRIMKQTPKWIPGEKADGEKVNVKYNLPISFVLPEKEKEV